jgi:TPR repeat protein
MRLVLFALLIALPLAGQTTNEKKPKSRMVEQDIAVLQAKAEKGDAEAQFEVGNRYYSGEGVPQDDVEAVKWYRKAADQGYAAAQFNLGNSHRTGEGVPQDDVEAVKWYRKAADQGDSAAQFNLGICYRDGRGVPQDYVEAHAWLNLSAASGDASAAKHRHLVARKLTPQGREQAQARSRKLYEEIQARKEKN